MFVFALRPMSACESLGEKAEGRRANTGLQARAFTAYSASQPNSQSGGRGYSLDPVRHGRRCHVTIST